MEEGETDKRGAAAAAAGSHSVPPPRALLPWLEESDFGHSGAFCAPSPGIAPKSWEEEEEAREMDGLNRDHPSKKKKGGRDCCPPPGR